MATHTTQGYRTAVTRSKSVSQETEEDEDQNEVDPYQNWSTHSAEIAKYKKISQVLEKHNAYTC